MATRKQRLRAEAVAANGGRPVEKQKAKPQKKVARGK
jgi:hypothetical protein